MSASSQPRALRILHLEDDAADSDLVRHSLAQGGIAGEIVRVETRSDFERELAEGDFDVVFSDYTIPMYDGASALEYVRRVRPEIPFILVSGTLGEEAAVNSLLGGAVDYVIKDRLWRLVPALQRALKEAENRRARRQAEKALQASEQRYRRLFETTSDGTVLLDASTQRILDANHSFLELLGRPLEELVGKTLLEIGIAWDDETEAALRQVISSEHGHYPRVRLSATGGRAVEVELVASSYAVEANRIIQLNVRDITERRRLEEKLLQANKLEAVGRLAGGVAHDFNNLLVVINSYSEMAVRGLGPQHPLYADIEEVHKAGLRAAKLTSQLLAFSRQQHLRQVSCSLNAIIGELEKMLCRVIGEDIELRLRLAPDIKTVIADPGQIEQVIVNLVVNARDAMVKGGEIVIETANVDLDDEYAAARADVTPGPYARLSVSDNGRGMDAETMAHMFEPFFTTKARDKGTGLGLATVYGIVKQSGGHIDVHSRRGQGTTVRVYLPRRDDTVFVPPPPERPAAARARATETILCVEDEAGVRRVVQRVLAPLGYRVLVAASGDEALALVEHHSGAIDLLITDVVLPKSNGYELSHALTSARPGMKVMYMSGYSEEAALRGAPPDPDAPFLQKPFTVTDLVREVRRTLGTEEVRRT